MLAALLTTVVFTAFVSFGLQTGKAQKIITLTEQNGVYDLTGIPDLEKKTVKLAPGSGYYPNTYLSPNDADSTAAESTDRFAEIRTDYLSQRLVLRPPDNSDT